MRHIVAVFLVDVLARQRTKPRVSVVIVLRFLRELDSALVGLDANAIARRTAHACLPFLGHAVFVDLCTGGEFIRAADAHAPDRPQLREALDRQAMNRTWRACVAVTIARRAPVFDPRCALPWAIPGAVGFIISPLRAGATVYGVLGAMLIGACHSFDELELARRVAYRAARALAESRNAGAETKRDDT